MGNWMLDAGCWMLEGEGKGKGKGQVRDGKGEEEGGKEKGSWEERREWNVRCKEVMLLPHRPHQVRQRAAVVEVGDGLPVLGKFLVGCPFLYCC